MMWLKIAWGLLSGNLSGIVNAIAGTLGKLSDNDTARTVAALQAGAAAWHDRADLLKSLRVTQWLVAAALIPPLLHQGMIYFDSSPFPVLAFEPWPSIRMHVTGSWQVPKAPPPYDDREWQMIAALLGIQTALSGAGTVLRLFGRRA